MRFFLPAALSLALALSAQAQNGDKKDEKNKGLMDRDVVPDDKVPKVSLLTPQEALADLKAPAGVKLSLAAAEPLVVMPVAAQFDARGRLWVVEMRSYMLDVDGKDENKLISKLACLEDRDGDGVFETRTDLVSDANCARAVLPFNDGVLYADNESLYFLEVSADLKPGKTTVVDAEYAKGGSLEHKPNGLLMHQDGWIYSAKCDNRYRRAAEGKWLKEKSEYRGQFGISSDPFGRLVTNTNGEFGSMEALAPNTLLGSPYLKKNWPAVSFGGACKPRRVTPGINRAYQPGGLNDEGKMKNATSASGPTFIYSDGMGEWQGLFTAEPAGYLVKFIRIEEDDKGKPKGVPPIKDTEFITATDELFRPVNCVAAPDGSLIILDMHMGILQHREFVTSYLRRYILKHGLDKFTGFGRLFRVSADNAKLDKRKPALDTALPAELIEELLSSNAWWRDMARRQIVERQLTDAIPGLIAILQHGRNESRVQSAWALAGLNHLDVNAVALALHPGQQVPPVARASIILSLQNFTPTAELVTVLAQHQPANEVEAAALARCAASLGQAAWPALDAVLAKWSGKTYVDEAALAGLGDGAAAYIARSSAEKFNAKVEALIAAAKVEEAKLLAKGKGPKLSKADQAMFDLGKQHYSAACFGCHGTDGQGMPNLGAPLDGSEWVTGDDKTLAKILLAGLRGPIHVAGKKLTLPLEMPGSMQNPAMDDKTLAAIATYLRNEWSNKAPAVKTETMAAVRSSLKERGAVAFTEEELKKETK